MLFMTLKYIGGKFDIMSVGGRQVDRSEALAEAERRLGRDDSDFLAAQRLHPSLYDPKLGVYGNAEKYRELERKEKARFEERRERENEFRRRR